jgi:gamma-glutamyltranspeptidase/glutathione hydrolase
VRRGRISVFLSVLCLLVAIVPAFADQGSRFRPAVTSRGGVIATESMPAAQVGLEVLNDGGNAVDAAVATTFAVGVSRPQSCGIGGGGFMVYRSHKGRTAALDFRETAPAAVTPQTFQGEGIHRTFTGHKTVGVPGTVAGLRAALERFGTISWEDAIAPAESLARNGIVVDEPLHTAMQQNQERLKMFPAAAEIYLVGGQAPYPVGSTLIQEDYAGSLALIADDGPKAFYEGEIADLIVADMERSRQDPVAPGDEGLMTADDLASYEAKWRTPLAGRYRDHRIVAMPPPTSGGIALIEMLNILEGFNLRRLGHSSADHFHFVAEAQKIAFADRGQYVADPDFEDVPTEQLISKRYAASRRQEIDRFQAKTYAPGDLDREQRKDSPGVEADRQGSTTHLSVIDRWGNAVALTCTIEQEFGSAVVAPGSGFLLNNELTDFGDPGTANEAEGGKRPRSSMSPTIVTHGDDAVLVTGGAGGVRIIMGVLHAVVNTIDFGMDVAHAIDAERMDAVRGLPLEIEDVRVNPVDLAELERRGHSLIRLGEYGIRPRVQGAAESRSQRHEDDKRGPQRSKKALREAVSDPRTVHGSVGQ